MIFKMFIWLKYSIESPHNDINGLEELSSKPKFYPQPKRHA